MTKQLSKRAKVNRAFAIHRELVELGNTVGQAFILIGQGLSEIKQDNLYKYLGEGGYDTFESYLASPELQISRRQAYYLISIYETFCKKLGLSIKQLQDAKPSALKEILPVVNKDNYKDWLEKSKVLSVSDIKIEVRKELSGIDPATCQHEWLKKIAWRCSNCGEVSYVNPEKNN